VAGGVRHANLLSDCGLQAIVQTVAGDGNRSGNRLEQQADGLADRIGLVSEYRSV
jgi:hypothetical protein